MSIQFIMLLVVVLAVIALAWWAVYSDAKREEDWRHEFIIIIMQSRKPLWMTTESIEQTARFYIDSGKWVKTPAHIAANREICLAWWRMRLAGV